MSEHSAEAAPRCGCATFAASIANAPSNPMHGLPGQMVVAAAYPLLVAPEFPPMGRTCPHGVKFWTYPDANRIEALTQMNESRYRPDKADS